MQMLEAFITIIILLLVVAGLAIILKVKCSVESGDLYMPIRRVLLSARQLVNGNLLCVLLLTIEDSLLRIFIPHLEVIPPPKKLQHSGTRQGSAILPISTA